MRRMLAVGALTALALLLTGCSGGADDTAAASDADADLYDIRQSQCDGIRAAGTITNTSGAEAAFEITAMFTYREGSSGLPIQTTVTEVLADGESAEFSISSDRASSGAASGCDIVGAEVVDAPASAEGAEGDGPDAETTAPDSLDEGWVAVGGGGTILVTEDGQSWFEVESPTTEVLFDVSYADGRWVAVGGAGVVVTSTDGVNWTAGDVGVEAQVGHVRFSEGQWQARPANGSDLLVSQEGSTWSVQEDVYAVDPAAPDHAEPFTVTAAGEGRELAIGRPGSYGGQLLQRADGGTWEAVSVEIQREDGEPFPAAGMPVADFATDGDGTWVFVGGINERQFVVSDGLDSWEARGDDVHGMRGVAHDGAGRWVAVGDRGRIFRDADGRTWERLVPAVTDVPLAAVVHTG